MVVVKIELNGDIRRVNLKETEQTYAKLVTIVKQLFVQELPENWIIKYKDEDGDMISVTCELEFSEAMNLASKGGLLKFFIIPKEKNVQSKASSDVEHPAICDHCDKTIVGIRYKCSVCPDYDLCETCEALGNVHDKGHCFLKIHNTFEAVRRPCRRFNTESSESGAAPRCPYMAQRCAKPDGQKKVKYFSRFVKDVTVEDGTHFAPGTKFVKVWRLLNNGNTEWPQGTNLIFLTGDNLSSVTRVPVPSVAPGEEIDISVDMVAPKKPGRVISHWRLSTPGGVEGSQFGHRVWADIIVDEEKEEPKPVVVETPKEVKVEVPEQPKPAVKVKKVDDDVPQGQFRNMLIELYDMGFTNIAQNRQVLVRRKGDLVAAVHELLNM